MQVEGPVSAGMIVHTAAAAMVVVGGLGFGPAVTCFEPFAHRDVFNTSSGDAEGEVSAGPLGGQFWRREAGPGVCFIEILAFSAKAPEHGGKKAGQLINTHLPPGPVSGQFG